MRIELSQPFSFCQPGKRSNQEDARFPDTDIPCLSQSFFVVCDGVGGHEKGEVASRTVCEAFASHLSHLRSDEPFGTEDFGKALNHAYASLYKAMNKHTREMATTLAFVCFHSEGVLAAHIGDSRIYHIRPQVGILYRSDDHSLVNALVHSGNLTPEEAEHHPKSNYITRCMGDAGQGEERSPATVVQITDIEPGDYFFLCTDGVLHQVSDEKLVEILSASQTDDEKCKLLATLSQDSIDNNTAYIVPIKNVTGTTCPTNKEMYSGSQTIPLRTKEIAVEVEAETASSIGSKVSGWLKKLFNAE